MRTEQNSDSSTIPELGIGRSVSPLPGTVRAYHQPAARKFLIANPRLKFSLSHRKISTLEISNREPMTIFRRAFSLFSGFEPQASSLQNLIANPELEFLLTHSKQRSGIVSNRKFSPLLHSPWRTTIFRTGFSSTLQPRASSLQNLIETARLEFPVTPMKQKAVQNLIETIRPLFRSVFRRKTRLTHQPLKHLLPASSLKLPASRPAPSL